MNNEQLIQWLRSNADVISFSAVETQIGAYSGLLSRVVKGKEGLPEKYVDRLNKLIDRICPDC